MGKLRGWGRNLLGERHTDGLMVGGRGHGADTVTASRQTTLDRGRQEAFSVTGVVDAFEKYEFGGVGCDSGG